MRSRVSPSRRRRPDFQCRLEDQKYVGEEEAHQGRCRKKKLNPLLSLQPVLSPDFRPTPKNVAGHRQGGACGRGPVHRKSLKNGLQNKEEDEVVVEDVMKKLNEDDDDWI